MNLGLYEFDNSLAYIGSSYVLKKKNLAFGPMLSLSQLTEFFLIMYYNQMLAEKENEFI